MDKNLMKGYKDEICRFTWTPRLSNLVLEKGGVQYRCCTDGIQNNHEHAIQNKQLWKNFTVNTVDEYNFKNILKTVNIAQYQLHGPLSSLGFNAGNWLWAEWRYQTSKYTVQTVLQWKTSFPSFHSCTTFNGHSILNIYAVTTLTMPSNYPKNKFNPEMI